MVFLFIFIVFVILLIIFALSNIQIQVANFKFNSQTQRHINKDYKVIIRLFIFGVIPVFKLNITKTKLEKMKSINFEFLEKNTSFDKEILKSIKKLNIIIKSFHLRMDIGTENASLTSIIVPAISTIFAILLRKKMKNFEKQKFVINPIYQNQNLVNLSLSGIFEVRMSHIINIIYMLSKKEKKGVKNYERTSHRGPYDYSYE